tara:strand:+ start:279 stop:467 length:189 start_codon:yes stop_codon:yes gene_type:complete
MFHTKNTRREMKEELLNVLFYTLAGMIFLSVLITVLILFLPYYLCKFIIEFFKNKKEKDYEL